MKKREIILIIGLVLGTAFIINNFTPMRLPSNSLENSIESSPDITSGCPFYSAYCIKMLKGKAADNKGSESKAKKGAINNCKVNLQKMNDAVDQCIGENTLRCINSGCIATALPKKNTFNSDNCKVTQCTHTTDSGTLKRVCIYNYDDQGSRIHPPFDCLFPPSNGKIIDSWECTAEDGGREVEIRCNPLN